MVEAVVASCDVTEAPLGHELSENTPVEWVAAAAEGLSDAAALSGSSERLIVTKISGTLVDTRPDTVRVAATLAALLAVGVATKELPLPERRHGCWSLKPIQRAK